MSNYTDAPFAILQSDLEPFVDVYERMNKILSTCMPSAYFTPDVLATALLFFENNVAAEVMIVDSGGRPLVCLPRNNQQSPALNSNEDVLRYLVACENLIPLLLARISQLEQTLCDNQSDIAKPIMEELVEKL